MKKFLVLLLTIIAVESSEKTVDLTHSYDDKTIVWPTEKKFKFKLVNAGSSGDYKAFKFCTVEHGGTHIDAPNHFYPDRDTTHEIPLRRLIGEAFIVDVSKEAKMNRDLLVTIDHFKKAEKEQKMTINNKIVLIYTGFSQYWPSEEMYLGTTSSNISLLHFPGIHPDAASWVASKRDIKSIGLDTASLDYGQSKTFRTHTILAKANIPSFENVNLKDIELFRSKRDTKIYALPMKIKGGSGGPLRIIAMYDFSYNRGSSFYIKPSMLFLLPFLSSILFC